MNPAAEDTYWRDSYTKAPYYSSQYTYDDYGPAYKLGYNSRGRYVGQSFDSVENDLANDWNSVKGSSRLTWNEAKAASRAA